MHVSLVPASGIEQWRLECKGETCGAVHIVINSEEVKNEDNRNVVKKLIVPLETKQWIADLAVMVPNDWVCVM